MTSSSVPTHPRSFTNLSSNTVQLPQEPIRNRYAIQVSAVVKCIPTNGRHTVRNRDTGETDTFSKSPFPNAHQTTGNRHALESGAPMKSTVPDHPHPLRDSDGYDRMVGVTEYGRPLSISNDPNRISLYFCRNHHCPTTSGVSCNDDFPVRNRIMPIP